MLIDVQHKDIFGRLGPLLPGMIQGGDLQNILDSRP